MTARFATIDIGTNTVLLLVAERTADGTFLPIRERAEITRLGQGVDASGALSPEAMERTLTVLERFADEARGLSVLVPAVVATSACRDARNTADFIAAARARAGLDVEVISGDEEARLSFLATARSFPGAGLTVLDIGGGSTELMAGDRTGQVTFRQSFDVGSVRLTERFAKHGPQAREATEAFVANAFARVSKVEPGSSLIGTAGTVTTVCAMALGLETYDAAQVHGAALTRAQVEDVANRLWAASLDERRRMKGLDPKRADVMPSGALILLGAMSAVGAGQLTVNDRGLRWGVLLDRWGKTI